MKMDKKRETKKSWPHSRPCRDDSKEFASSNPISNGIQKTIGYTMDESHYYLSNFFLEALKNDTLYDTQYELFPKYPLFEYNKIDKQVKVGEHAALYQWRRIDQDFSSIYNHSLVALNPKHVPKENTLQVNVNKQNEESRKGNNECDTVAQPNQIIIPSKLL